MWIFGYGSLIWNPDFDYVERVKCVIAGFDRRFYQGSHDHRGTEAYPGRVVTLVPNPSGVTHGVAYKLSGDAAQTMQALDFREKNGYQHLTVNCVSEDNTFEALTYIATANNIAYLGEAPLDQMVARILKAVGPSGANVEYLFELASALRSLEIEDSHVLALERRARFLLETV